MKPPPFRYVAPTTLDEALQVLADAGPAAKVLAGGQSLVPLLNMRLAQPSTIVDINRVEGLGDLVVTDDAVVIGATVRHARVLADHDVAAALPLLGQAIRHVAHQVIRNRGTVVGSIVHADPAAELPAVLALVGGSVELAGRDGTRSVAARDFFLAPMESAIRTGEIAVRATFPRLPATTRTAVQELARRHGDYAMAGVAVRVDVVDDRVTGARASFIGVTDVPEVVDLTEHLEGQDPADLDVAAAVDAGRDAIDPVADIHATAEYRRHLAGVLLGRALRDAASRPADSTAAAAGDPTATATSDPTDKDAA